MISHKKLSEYVKSYRNGFGKRPKIGEEGPIVLRIADVSSGSIELSDPRRGDIDPKEADTYKLATGDLIFIRVNGAKHIVGRCCVVGPEVPAGTIFNDHLIRVQINSELDPYFARLVVSSPPARKVIEDAATTSAGQLTINQQVLDSLEIPDLPIERQRQIARHVGKKIAEVEKAQLAARTQLREVSSLAGAIVMDTIRNSPTKPYLLGDVLDEVKHGIGAGWADHPVLGATREGLAPAKEQPGKMAPKYKPVTPGTVFYNPMRILIGSIAFVDDDDASGITSPDYVALRGKPGRVDSRWFYYWLRSHLGAQCILSLARGAVRERMLFNRLADGKIDLPSPEAQEKASRALRELKPLQRALKSKLAEIDLLPQKILAQAFEM